MMQALDIICGISWSITYIAAIFLGIKRRTWCIPRLAMCLNFSWELLVVVNRLQNGSMNSVAFIIQLTWLILDIAILGTWFLQDNKLLPQNIVLLAVVMMLMYTFAYRGGHWEISVFLVNVIMSIEFIYRTTKDYSLWTSKLIATTKLIGTLAATLANGVLQKYPILLWLGGLCFIFDFYYVMLLCTKDFSNR